MYEKHKFIQTFKQEFIAYAQNLNICALGIAPVQLVKTAPPITSQLPPALNYLTAKAQIRTSPELIHKGTKCIITVAMSYDLFATPQTPQNDTAYLSAYAQGRDYHKVLKKRLNSLGAFLQQYFLNHVTQFLPYSSVLEVANIEDFCQTPLNFRAIADSCPFPEQYIAESIGLTSIGYNNLGAVYNIGSQIFLGELLVDLNLLYLFKLLEEPAYLSNQRLFSPAKDGVLLFFPISKDQRNLKSTCPKNCQLCVNNCPTHAINADKFKPELCISYLTIEAREDIPFALWQAIGTRIYGCDSCQLCCPRCQHKHSKIDPDFSPRFNEEHLKFKNLLTLTANDFTKMFAGTAIMHIGYKRFMRNVFTAVTNATITQELINLVSARVPEFPEYQLTLEHALQLMQEKLTPHLVSTPSKNQQKL